MPQQQYPVYYWQKYLLELNQYAKEIEKYVQKHTSEITALDDGDDSSLPPPPPPPNPPQ